MAVAYVVYDPGSTGVLSTNELPTLKDLGVTGKRDE
jgi:hypothetical protein